MTDGFQVEKLGQLAGEVMPGFALIEVQGVDMIFVAADSADVHPEPFQIVQGDPPDPVLPPLTADQKAGFGHFNTISGSKTGGFRLDQQAGEVVEGLTGPEKVIHILPIREIYHSNVKTPLFQGHADPSGRLAVTQAEVNLFWPVGMEKFPVIFDQAVRTVERDYVWVAVLIET